MSIGEESMEPSIPRDQNLWESKNISVNNTIKKILNGMKKKLMVVMMMQW